MKKTYRHCQAFVLENGRVLPELQIAYHTYGVLNADASNVVWVCHALTANSNVFDWWSGLFGANDLFNPNDYFIVCANNLGSCYGTTGPIVNTGTSLYAGFPLVTIRDMVEAHKLLKAHLGIQKIKVLIGGSQGGQQALEWAISENEHIEHLVLMACNARHSAWGIAFNESQRLAIKADRTYYGNTPDGGQKGLAAARSMALLSYRHYEPYNASQTDAEDDKLNDYKVAAYQRYQGEKLVKRFNAYAYVTLANAMDTHHVGRKRGSIADALQLVKAKTLVIGITSDVLFPISEQQVLAQHISNAQLITITSPYGHDGFLIETEQLSQQIQKFLNKTKLAVEALASYPL